MAAAPLIQPLDEHNRALIENVHPPGWRNPQPAARYDLVVIGAGTAGLVTAAGAAGVGARVALVERHLMGGDCLNVGCVPSKSLLRSAHAAAEVGRAGELGVRIPADGTQVDFAAVMERMRSVRRRISPNDSARRFQQELGVDVFFGEARFVAGDRVAVGDTELRFSRAVVATGARALVPPIPGLAEAGYLTNENVFESTTLPRRLLVLGGGPIGCELAQAFRRFGAGVTMVEMAPRFLVREDPDAAAILLQQLQRDGVDVRLDTKLLRIEPEDAGGHAAVVEHGGKEERIGFDAVLVGVGRAPNVEGLGLEVAGVDFDRSGIRVDDFLRTSNPRILACGDVCMQYKFTHAADFAARAVVQNALFFGRKRLSALTIPWCTYTDPEIAHMGVHAHDAAEHGLEVDTFTQPFAEVDRAIAEGRTEGFVRIHTEKGKDRIVGATIVNPHAGEMISEIGVAMASGLGLGRLANVIHPYPTQAEAIRKLGDAYNRTRLTPTVRWILARVLALRRRL